MRYSRHTLGYVVTSLSIAGLLSILLSGSNNQTLAMNVEEGEQDMAEQHQDKHLNYVEFQVGSVEDLARTRDFFTQAFGWKYQMWGEQYADTQSSGVTTGIIAAGPDTQPTPLPALYVKDLEGTLHKVQQAGAEIIKPIYSFPGGRRFNFREPSGHELIAYTDQPLKE